MIIDEPQIYILWNTRGKAIKVEKPELIKLLLQQGFRRAEEGVIAGQYNPIYDQGENKDNDIQNIEEVSNQIGDVLHVIRI